MSDRDAYLGAPLQFSANCGAASEAGLAMRLTITRIISATPSAIESPVNDDASARCLIFRQAIFQKLIVASRVVPDPD